MLVCPQQLLGSPEDSDLGFVRSENARKYVKQLQCVPKQPFLHKFLDVSPTAIDLEEKMLVFDPSEHISGTPLASFLCSVYLSISCCHIFTCEILLLFDMYKVEEALNHPFLSSLHEINEEPTCPSPFVFDFEQSSLSEEDIKELVWRQSLTFNQDEVE